MRSKLLLGPASLAALLIVIGATSAALFRSRDVSKRVSAVVPARTVPADSHAEPSCCCAAKPASGSDQLLYCPLTDTVNTECCCVLVDGKWVCLVTGIVSDECCCIPLTNAK